jgi:outer membrane protein
MEISMKKKLSQLTLVAATLICGSSLHAASQAKSDIKQEVKSEIGIVNFTNCITESKVGKKEQESLESIKNQMTTLIKDIENQLNDISAKFSDPDYLDGLTPEGENEQKMKFQALKEEYDRYQNQFYQVMQQANMKLVQTVSSFVNSATDKIAQNKNLSLVVNKDACFSFKESFDITQDVIQEMDKVFDEMEKQTAKAPAKLNAADASSTK